MIPVRQEVHIHLLPSFVTVLDRSPDGTNYELESTARDDLYMYRTRRVRIRRSHQGYTFFYMNALPYIDIFSLRKYFIGTSRMYAQPPGSEASDEPTTELKVVYTAKTHQRGN